MFSAAMVLVAVALGGLVFVMFVGQRKRNSRGGLTVGAPGSPDSPVFSEPETKPFKAKP
jgi:hypothetical protein